MKTLFLVLSMTHLVFFSLNVSGQETEGTGSVDPPPSPSPSPVLDLSATCVECPEDCELCDCETGECLDDEEDEGDEDFSLQADTDVETSVHGGSRVDRFRCANCIPINECRRVSWC